jgi:regulator of nucleoside diphosphate kinase
MTARTPIISDLDFDRLHALVESPQYRSSHAQRVAELQRELDDGEVVPPTEVPPSVVTMNSRVRVRDLESGECEEYTLCYPGEANIADAKLSVLAPLGTALLGARVGETIEFAAPAGTQRLSVEKIPYQPEREGAFHL